MTVLGVGKNRETRAETQPFRAKSCEWGSGSPRFCCDDEPEARSEFREFMPINLAQTSLHLVSNDSGTDASRNNDSRLGRKFLIGEQAHADE